jgi:hypothetical protein
MQLRGLLRTVREEASGDAVMEFAKRSLGHARLHALYEIDTAPAEAPLQATQVGGGSDGTACLSAKPRV